MALLLMEDLTSANDSGSKEIASLMTDKEDAQQLINLIQNFISNSTEELKGNAYDKVRNHMSGYIDILETRIKVADSIIQSIKSANNSLIDYMEDESKLDTDELDSLKAELSSAQETVNSYNYRIDNYDASEETVSLYGLKMNRATWESRVKKLKKKIELIEGLSGADGDATGKLNESETDIANFKATVNGITNIKIEQN